MLSMVYLSYYFLYLLFYYLSYNYLNLFIYLKYLFGIKQSTFFSLSLFRLVIFFSSQTYIWALYLHHAYIPWLYSSNSLSGSLTNLWPLFSYNFMCIYIYQCENGKFFMALPLCEETEADSGCWERDNQCLPRMSSHLICQISSGLSWIHGHMSNFPWAAHIGYMCAHI